MYVVTLALLCLLAISQSMAVNPGVKMRITQKGLNYANTIARKLIDTELPKLHIPDQNGDDKGFNWYIKNIQIRGVDKTHVTEVKVSPDQKGINFSIKKFGMQLYADWRVKKHSGLLHPAFNGGAEISASDVSLSVTPRLGSDKAGRPTILDNQCSGNIGNFNIHFRGGWKVILNMFKGIASNLIKKLLNGQLCNIVNKVIKDNANKFLGQMTVTQELDHKFILNYGLTTAPVIKSGYVETWHKGEFVWKANHRAAPGSPATIPTSSATSNMLYLWASDFEAKSLAYLAHTNKYLERSITKADLPASSSNYLSTCKGAGCAGQVIPELATKYPNSVLELRVKSAKTPDVTLKKGSISVSLSGAIEILVHKPDRSVVNVVTLQADLSLSVRAKIVNERLTAEISSHSLKVNVNSVAGKLNTNGVNTFLQKITHETVVPAINKYGKTGILLPITKDVRFHNTVLQVLDGAIMVGTDVSLSYAG